MEKIVFQVNYKKQQLYYTKEQKRKIDYMKDWEKLIKCLKWHIKNDKIRNKNCITHYISSAINNYSFYIQPIIDSQYIIKDIDAQ